MKVVISKVEAKGLSAAYEDTLRAQEDLQLMLREIFVRYGVESVPSGRFKLQGTTLEIEDVSEDVDVSPQQQLG